MDSEQIENTEETVEQIENTEETVEQDEQATIDISDVLAAISDLRTSVESRLTAIEQRFDGLQSLAVDLGGAVDESDATVVDIDGDGDPDEIVDLDELDFRM